MKKPVKLNMGLNGIQYLPTRDGYPIDKTSLPSILVATVPVGKLLKTFDVTNANTISGLLDEVYVPGSIYDFKSPESVQEAELLLPWLLLIPVNSMSTSIIRNLFARFGEELLDSFFTVLDEVVDCGNRNLFYATQLERVLNLHDKKIGVALMKKLASMLNVYEYTSSFADFMSLYEDAASFYKNTSSVNLLTETFAT